MTLGEVFLGDSLMLGGVLEGVISPSLRGSGEGVGASGGDKESCLLFLGGGKSANISTSGIRLARISSFVTVKVTLRLVKVGSGSTTGGDASSETAGGKG